MNFGNRWLPQDGFEQPMRAGHIAAFVQSKSVHESGKSGHRRQMKHRIDAGEHFIERIVPQVDWLKVRTKIANAAMSDSVL